MASQLPTYMAVLHSLKPELENKFNVSAISIFGSFVRGEEHSGSDLDVLVTYSKTPDLFDIAALTLFLEQKLSIKIDLVPNLNLKKTLSKHIIAEKVDII